jgi:HAD superfamily hydrolase (TIGR01509 family)
MSLPAPRAVLLDFGGTLFSYSRMNGPTVRLLLRAAERLGVKAEPREVIVAYRSGSREAWAEYLPRTFYLHRDLFRETFRRFAEHLGGDPSGDFLDWFHEEQRSLAVDHLELRAGCLETLRELRATGLHVAIVSNIDEDYLEPMLERAGIADLIDARTSSEEARSCKPDPAIFHHALEKAIVRAEEAVFVGDSPEADVLGARKVGMTTVLILDDGAPPPGAGAGPSAEADHEIRELGELIPIVRRRGA